MKFVLHKDKIVTGTTGHTIEFKKGELTHVPKEMWLAVQAVGAIPEDELPEDFVEVKKEVTDPAERKAALFAAFKTITDKNDRDDFTGSGTPKDKVVEAITGFKADSKERNEAWAEFKQEAK